MLLCLDSFVLLPPWHPFENWFWVFSGSLLLPKNICLTPLFNLAEATLGNALKYGNIPDKMHGYVQRNESEWSTKDALASAKAQMVGPIGEICM